MNPRNLINLALVLVILVVGVTVIMDQNLAVADGRTALVIALLAVLVTRVVRYDQG